MVYGDWLGGLGQQQGPSSWTQAGTGDVIWMDVQMTASNAASDVVLTTSDEPVAVTPKVVIEESPLAWLDRRVDEVRVAL